MIPINKTAFSTKDDFIHGLLEIDTAAQNFPSGGIPLYTQGNKAYLDTSDTHSIIFGATGSKKTRLFVMPSIEIYCRSSESFVVTDPKGEIYQKTKDSAKAYGYRTVCLDLRNLQTSTPWNPLQLPYQLYHGGKKEKALEMLTELSRLIIGDVGEEFWTNTGIDMLLGFLLVLILNNSYEDCTLRNLLKLWDKYNTHQRRFRNALTDGEYKTDELVISKLRMIYNESDKTVGSTVAIVSTGLNKLLINNELVDLLSTNSFSLDELANKKVAVYLIIPDENSSYHFIASLFISQIYEVLIQAAQKSETKTLNIRMNFVIDEFANLPKLTNIDSMITASRSRNIRFSLIVQGLTQLKNKYDDAALTLCGNCNNWIYLYSKDYELLHTLSQLCGEVVYDDHTRLPLLSEFDLQHLSKEKGEVLILSDRKYPFLSHLTDIDDYTFFREFPENPEPAEQAVENTKEVPSDDYRPLSGPFHELEFPTTCFAPKYQKPVPMPKTLFDSLAGENAITSDWSYCRGPKRWLVATLDNIIIAEKTLPEDEFDSPDILENLIKYFGKRDVIGDYMLRSYITFYHANLRNKKDYESYLSKHPEVLYLRIDEMEHPEDFIPISSSTDTHNNDDQKTEDSNED